MMSALSAEFLKIAKECAPELFIELYCGCGVFSVLAAEAGIEKVYGWNWMRMPLPPRS